jgi:glyoxylase-like metal-dependent hydrolase (beta-lactamase superfamily II)
LKIFDDIFYYRHPLGANANVYAFKDGGDIDLIDTGIGRFNLARRVWREMRQDGLEPTNIRRIIHPHYHFDHVQADSFFISRALKYKNNVEVFVPVPDIFRTKPDFSLTLWSRLALEKKLKPAQIEHFRKFNWFSRALFEPLVACKTQPDILTLIDGKNIALGKRKAKVYTTGGHTEGHSFLHIDDGDNILYTGDHDAMNEYSCDWGKILNSVRLAQKISPDNVFIGHNSVKLGKDKAMGFINGYFAQFEKIFAPILSLFKSGQTINLTKIIHAKMGWLRKIKIISIWAHMGLFAIAKYLEQNGLGTFEINEQNHFEFRIEKNPAEVDLISLIITGK